SMGNMCMVMFGYDMIHITVFQPDKSRSEYCDEIPATGRTIMAFDIENPAFRDLPLELRIIRDPLTPVLPTGEKELDALTELHLPAKKYSKGTFSVEHNFANNGHYIGLVTLTRESGQQETAQFKFMVG
uniref:PmoD n=2 Tax=Methylocystis sp. ATCC 49242 TaxID=622637 RepID=A0ACD6BAU2_9HYPH|nr:Chain A, PmoD [Methylocystis sp. ATCC 49242]6CPD_B Chain B, PmoD [Methylocystis sp. ATCC 49242]